MSWTQGLRARGIGLKLLALGAMLALVVGAMGVSTNGAAAQTFGGAGLRITSLGGGQVLVAWTGIGSGLTLLRITDVDATTAGTSTTLTATQTTLTDTVPAAANVACYLILGPGGSRSDLLCALLGLATSLGPDDISITLGQSNNATVTWVGPTGTTSWIVLALGVSTTTVTTPSVVIATGGLFTCVIILGANTLSDGVCGLPGFTTGGGPTATPTATACPTIPIVGTPLCIPTVPPTATGGTLTPSSTATPAVTATPTATATNTSTPTVTNTPSPVNLTVTMTDLPDPVTPGQSVRYTSTITNIGGTQANDLQVTVRAPIGTTILNADGATGSPFFGRCGTPVNTAEPGNPVDFIVSCQGTLGASGSTTANSGQILTDVSIPGSFTCANSPLTGTTIGDPNKLIVPAAVTATTQTLITACPTATRTPSPTATTVSATGLTFTKSSAPVDAVGGGGLTWTLSLANASGATISGISLQDTIPGTAGVGSGLSLNAVSATHSFACGPQTGTSGTVVVCGGGSIPDGQTATITLVTQVLAAACTGFASTTERTNSANIVAPAVPNPIATRRPACNTPTLTLTPTSTVTLTPTATLQPADLDAGFNVVLTNQTAATYDVSAQYTVFNDGTVVFTGPNPDGAGPLLASGVTISGTVSGSAPRSTITSTLTTGTGVAGTFACDVTTVGTPDSNLGPGVAGTWRCSADLAAAVLLDIHNNVFNSGGFPATGITVTVNVTGVASTGQSVVFNAPAPTCLPIACQDSVVSNGNNEGSDLTPGNWVTNTITLN